MSNGVKRVYVSGGMSGIEGHNFPAFNAMEAELRSLGFEVENPATKGIIPGWTWEEYLAWDIARLLECDAICLLDGWENSRGARLECHIAEQLGYKRVFADGEVMDLSRSLETVN